MAAELLPGEERVFSGDGGYRGLEKREKMAGGDVEHHLALMFLNPALLKPLPGRQ